MFLFLFFFFRKEYLFGFSNSYEIVEDMDLLKSMNLSLGIL